MLTQLISLIAYLTGLVHVYYLRVCPTTVGRETDGADPIHTSRAVSGLGLSCLRGSVYPNG